ncbi:MAG: hypothetical protein N2260_06300 [Syntrophobacterales bacterium]|nr:hypothetical protein [Syntrophobacterales bacterium]
MKYGSASTNLLRYVSPTDEKNFRDPLSSILPWELAFDVDGVVADTMAVFVEVVKERLGMDHFSKDHIREYDLSRCLPNVKREVIDELICLVLSDEYTLKIPPCPGASEFLRKFSNYAPLRFVTARVWPESVTRWLHNLLPDVPKEAIQVIATGDPNKKSSILRDMKVKVFVEDRWDTCLKLHTEGFGVIVYDQPWNRKGSDFPRVFNWYELEEFILWP